MTAPLRRRLWAEWLVALALALAPLAVAAVVRYVQHSVSVPRTPSEVEWLDFLRESVIFLITACVLSTPVLAVLSTSRVALAETTLARRALGLVATVIGLATQRTAFQWMYQIHPEPVSDLFWASAWFVAAFVVASAIVFTVARRFGWRWRRADEPLGPPVRFTIRATLAATLAIAAALAIARAIVQNPDAADALAAGMWGPSSSPRGYLQMLLGIALPFEIWLPALAAFAAMAGPRGRVTSALLAFVFAGGLGWLIWYVDSNATLELGATFNAHLMWTLLPTLYTLVALALWRLVGWRVDRLPATTNDESSRPPGSPSVS